MSDMTGLQAMQDKAVKVVLGGQEFTARQLFIADWAKVERELQGEPGGLSKIFAGELSVIGYTAMIKCAIGRELPPKTQMGEVITAAGAILNLDIADTPSAPNSPATPEEA